MFNLTSVEVLKAYLDSLIYHPRLLSVILPILILLMIAVQTLAHQMDYQLELLQE